ncbi:MAG TPA: YesL family protein [Tessaracoccus flavescens]|uniref:YesL family protein n=1 Tax=Tessaracoccus flavescens TaxID=399497 RepID=A0A921ER24_9ACTN|nr:YesL family protein [Tessaracoccus flavescens]
MQVDLNGRTYSGLTTLIQFVVLNVCYLLVCLPVVTIGVATASLVEVTYRFADEERGNLIKDFFGSLRKNFTQATIVLFALGLPAALLGFSAVFWFQYESAVSGAAAILSSLGSAYLLASFLHGEALVATHTNTTKQLLKNSLLLPTAEALRTLGLIVIPVACIALTYVAPGFIYVMLTIGCALAAYGAAFLLRSIYRRHGDPASAG